jgi:microcystin-dependent protein
MPLVFRSSQNTPLTNSQLDGNFQYLVDQINLKYDIASFTADNISIKLNTLESGQTVLQRVEENALNAWLLRSVAPSEELPGTTDKTSIPVRSSTGAITATTFNGNLNGNASTATSATSANEASSLSSSYTVPVARGGTGSNTASAARTALQVVHLGGDQQMTGKLRLLTSTTTSASINLGASTQTLADGNKANGDVWATSTGLFFHINGATGQVASLNSPTFTGTPIAPDGSGNPSQIATVNHLSASINPLSTSISQKADINSPSLTGIPTAPTAATSTNTSQIATTAFVQSVNTQTTNSITNAYVSYTNSAITSERNSINISLSTKANINSPTFTGTPTAPTPSSSSNDSSIATTAFVNNYVNAYNTTFNASITSLNQQIADTRPVPVGAVFYMLNSMIPEGYLEANGQAVSRTTYSALWNYLGQPNTGNETTTFNVPDLRGEFIRCWDNGRGIDTGRTIRSVQSSQNQDHYHASPNPVDNVTTSVKYPFGYVEISGVSVSTIDDSTGTTGFVPKTQSVGGSESRPRNVALVPVIKW